MVSVLFFFLLFSKAWAKDLGTFGETWAVQEKNLLHVIQSKLLKLERTGALENHQKHLQEHFLQRVQTPAEVVGIQATKNPRVFFYDPTLIVPYDLKDHQGKIFYPQGTRINPLGTHQLSKPLLFIDGSDKKQEAWAKREQYRTSLAKVILIKGSPFELMKRFSEVLFFDQGGVLTKKLGITQAPARVTQDGLKLKIEEVRPDAP